VVRALPALTGLWRRGIASAAFALLALVAGAATPPPEQLLPDDTLLVLTAPSFPQLRQLCQRSPKSRLWNDPALKPLKDKFLARWREEVATPLQRDLGLSLDSYSSLLQGQVTFAVTKGAWQGAEDQPLGFLFLLDARDKAGVLRTNLATLRTKWLAAGRRFRTEKIRDVDLTVFPVNTNDLPKSVVKLLWRPPVFAQLSGGAEVRQAQTTPSTMGDTVLDMLSVVLTSGRELVVGQVGSCLVAGNSVPEVEKLVIRLTGGARPTLGEVAAYQSCQLSMFGDAPFYGWLNAKAIVEAVSRKAVEAKQAAPADPLDLPRADKLAAVTGLAGCKSLAFDLRDSAEGSTLRVSLSVPESARRGLFQILAGPAREAAPPAFVPADAAQFFRWRMDGPRTWASLEKLLNDLSPQGLSSLNLILNTADARARQEDPGFRLKETLLANLGDDLISYDRAPRGTTAAQLQYSPSLVLIGSPQPDLLAVVFKRLFVIFPQGDNMTEREFLGRKIYSVPAPSLPLFPGASSRATPARTLHWAASGSYVALAADPALLEEYLRGTPPQAKTLHDTAGLVDAAQKVGGMGTGLLGYENEANTMRAAFEAARTDPGASTNGIGPSLFPGLPGLTGPEDSLTDWMDFSLLPAFDKVAQYFSYSLFAVSANTEGLTLKTFAPTPPALRSAALAKPGN
jgi:hypothetical protein